MVLNQSVLKLSHLVERVGPEHEGFGIHRMGVVTAVQSSQRIPEASLILAQDQHDAASEDQSLERTSTKGRKIVQRATKSVAKNHCGVKIRFS